MAENKEITKKALQFGKFNFVDLLIVLSILAVIVFLFLFRDSFSSTSGGDVKVSYTVCLSGVDAAYVNKIREGDPIFDANTGRFLGTVSAVESGREHTVFRYDEKTGGSMEPIPDSYDVFVTVSADAVFEKTVGYSVEEKRIAVGAEYMLLFPDFAGKGYCITIREVE